MNPEELTIVVKYSCHECGLRDVEVPVPARTTEDVVDWMEATFPLLGADHQRRNPHCHPRELQDLKIPLSGADKIGGPIAH